MSGPLEKILQNQLTESETKIRFLSEIVQHFELQISIAKDIIKENKSSISNYKKKYEFLKSQVDIMNDSIHNHNNNSNSKKLKHLSSSSNTFSSSRMLSHDEEESMASTEEKNDSDLEDDCRDTHKRNENEALSPLLLTPHPSKHKKRETSTYSTNLKRKRKLTYEEKQLELIV